jgi:hypothetical protein
MARKEQSERLQPFTGHRITFQTTRLAHRRAVPVQPQPSHVGEDFRHEFGAAAGAVDILDPQQRLAATRPREIMRDNGGISVPEVQRAVWAGGKAGADHGSHLSCGSSP